MRGVAAHFEASSRLACYGIVVAAEGGIDGDGSMTSMYIPELLTCVTIVISVIKFMFPKSFRLL